MIRACSTASDFTGAKRLWIEVGQPDDKALQKACNKSDAVAAYAYGPAAEVWWKGIENKLTRQDKLEVWRLPAEASQQLAALAERSMQLQATVQEGALTLSSKENFADLTGKARIRWYLKTSGFHEVRPVLKLADGTWLIGDHADAFVYDYHVSEFYLAEVHWLKLDMPKVLTKGTLLDKVDLSKVDEIGRASCRERV